MTAMSVAAATPATFDVEKTIADFMMNPSETSLELPHMTTGQRKNAKRVAERYPELSCESFGFGQDRQLHLFKKGAASKKEAVVGLTKNEGADAPASQQARPLTLLERVPEVGLSATSNAGCAVSVKNTFIDDWVAAESKQKDVDAPVMRSMPPQLNKSALHAALQEESGVMYVLSDQKPSMNGLKSAVALCASPAPSTAAPSCDPSASPNSPAVSDLEARVGMTPPPFSLAAAIPAPSMHVPSPTGIAPPPGLSVRNTFIHIGAPEASDERVVQSMPHDMFRQSLVEEMLQSLNSRAAAKVNVSVAAAGLSCYDAAAAALSTCASDSVASQSATSTPPRPFPAPSSAFGGYLAGTVLAPPVQQPLQPPPAMMPRVQPPPAAPAFPATALLPGAEVIIEGLSKMPAFNGLRGTVQSFDQETGRYNVALVTPTATGHRSAKLKAENLKQVAGGPCMMPPTPLAPLRVEPELCLSTSGCALNAAPLMSTQAPWNAAIPDAGDRAAMPQALRLTALV